MKFDIVTIFPAVIREVTSTGVLGRAVAQRVLDVAVHDLRDFTTDRHRSVDDVPYGGGPGMVLKLEPFVRALDRIRRDRGAPRAVVLTSPQGAAFTHREAVRLSALDHVVLLCGRYEGVDERVGECLATEELSIGDYVLSGGELPACVILDAVARQVPGVVGDRDCVDGDSFVRRLLDFPHYTRPAELDEHRVPEVLTSGNHAAIRNWRKREALRRTRERRPDLLVDASLDDEERAILREFDQADRQKTEVGA